MQIARARGADLLFFGESVLDLLEGQVLQVLLSLAPRFAGSEGGSFAGRIWYLLGGAGFRFVKEECLLRDGRLLA